MTLRPLNHDELFCLRAVLKAALGSLKTDAPEFMRKHIAATLDMLENPDHMFLVMDKEGKELGACKLKIEDINLPKDTIKFILNQAPDEGEEGGYQCN